MQADLLIEKNKYQKELAHLSRVRSAEQIKMRKQKKSQRQKIDELNRQKQELEAK